MKLIIILFAGLAFNSAAHAAIVCNGTTGFGKIKVTVDKTAVSIEGAQLDKKVFINNTTDVWDGHGTGLITAPGFSMKYNNWYGCIRNVSITTNLRSHQAAGYIDTFEVSTCTGGSTPDDLCRAE